MFSFTTTVGATAPLQGSNYPPRTMALDASKNPWMNIDGVNWCNLSDGTNQPTADLFLLPVGESVTFQNIGNP